MAKGYLIDTSAVIKYLNQTFSAKAILFIDNLIDAESNLSFVTEIELQAWNPVNPADLLVCIQFVQLSNITGIDRPIIDEAINIRKNYKLKIADAIIAATAIVNDLTLLADNDKDFKKIPSLSYLNPKTIA
jgi:predicted nucleic acid-binding protein